MMFRIVRIAVLIVMSLSLVACDKGKKPYEEAEVLFSKSDYDATKSKAAEVVQNAPKSKYLAQAKALYEKVEKIEALFITASDAAKTGDYDKAIKNYSEILALDPKSPKALDELKKTNDTYSNLKQLGDEAMKYFRIYSRAMSVRRSDYDLQGETARIKYLQKLDVACGIKGGQTYFAGMLKGYLEEVDTALKDFIKKSKAINQTGGYEKRVLAANEYNRALDNFIANYGQPEAWLQEKQQRIIKEKQVAGWVACQ